MLAIPNRRQGWQSDIKGTFYELVYAFSLLASLSRQIRAFDGVARFAVVRSSETVVQCPSRVHNAQVTLAAQEPITKAVIIFIIAVSSFCKSILSI